MEVLPGPTNVNGTAAGFFLRFELLRFDVAADFHGAARIYRACQREGMTPRGLVDYMIASVALRWDAALLARDVD